MRYDCNDITTHKRPNDMDIKNFGHNMEFKQLETYKTYKKQHQLYKYKQFRKEKLDP